MPTDLLCIDFTKIDPSRDSKDNVSVLTDALSRFNQALIATFSMDKLF